MGPIPYPEKPGNGEGPPPNPSKGEQSMPPLADGGYQWFGGPEGGGTIIYPPRPVGCY